MPHSRRTFLKGAGVATAVVSAAPLSLALQEAPGTASPAAAAAPRGFAAGNFALELDGRAAGVVVGFQGGNAVADVVEFRSGDDEVNSTKSLGDIHYEEIVIMTGFAMDAVLWDWVAKMLEGTAVHMDGAIIAADANLNVLRRMEFHNALLTEVSFPTLDAASKDVAHMTIKFQPESTVLVAGTGKLPTTAAAKQKLWLASNFKLEVDGLPCGRVNKIEALTVKQNVTEFSEGGGRRFS